MALGQRLEIRQGQSLVMTPQLQQAIKLLQLSNIELAAFVEAEMERNPLLQRDENESSDGDSAPEAPSSTERDELTLGEHVDVVRAEDAVDAEYESIHPEAADIGGSVDWSRTGTGATSSSSGADGDMSWLENASVAVSLRDKLKDQLMIAARDDTERAIGAALIDLVDDDGYMRAEIGEIAERLGTTHGRVEAALALCQGFEPTGVMARNLAECLTLQLKERDRFDPAMEALIANLELLARHDYPGLRKLCGVDEEDLREMVSELRALCPKPGHAFGNDENNTVEPDVFVREKGDGGWAVELNSDTLPRVLMDSRYYAEVSRAARDEQSRAFISELHQNASWLIKSLDQRARTILKVASEIVRQQDMFFVEGVEHLRPLNLKTVAEAIGMHESTVSRVTTNKYMSTPRGLFELKYFFTASIAASGDGEAHSAEAVRYRIRHLIERETVEEVFSDDRIVEMLVEEGIDIARRTVAKYREALRIPSSVQRRRMLKQAG
jgi:RNA polymerase sigma-54 factor